MSQPVRTYYLQHDLTRPLSPWPTRPGMGTKPPRTANPFAAELRAERLRAGLSLRQLAAQTGLGVITIGDLERGKTQPTARTRAALLRALPGLGGGRAGQ